MPSQRAPTVDDLRRRIGRGEAADKVDFPDPAAAPLGTDAEAAGAPPGETARERAARNVQRGDMAQSAPEARRSSPPLVTLGFFALIALCALAILVYAAC